MNWEAYCSRRDIIWPLVLAAVLLLVWWISAGMSRRISVGGLRWRLEDYCSGWLITGGTGTGKTRSGLMRLLHETFRCYRLWGGLVVDDKGHFHETVRLTARHFGREADVLLLRAATDTRPTHRFNLTGNRLIPSETYSRMVVDTAIAMGQRQDQSFFRTQGRDQIAAALEVLHLLGCEVTLENVYHLLLDASELSRVIGELRHLGSPSALRLAEHFESRYLKQPVEQLGGVQGSIANYLTPYLTPAVAEVFCRDSTFSFDELDQGKILCVALPQKFAVERRYVNTFLKQLFYFHALSRYDATPEVRARHNLLVLWADEAQHFVTDSEEGLSDYTAVDRIREARATVVFATQSIASFHPPLGKEKADVLRLNLRNRMVFQAATEMDALDAADFLGKRRRYRTYRAKDGTITGHRDEELHRVKPYQFRLLRPHQAVVIGFAALF